MLFYYGEKSKQPALLHDKKTVVDKNCLPLLLLFCRQKYVLCCDNTNHQLKIKYGATARRVNPVSSLKFKQLYK